MLKQIYTIEYFDIQIILFTTNEIIIRLLWCVHLLGNSTYRVFGKCLIESENPLTTHRFTDPRPARTAVGTVDLGVVIVKHSIAC